MTWTSIRNVLALIFGRKPRASTDRESEDAIDDDLLDAWLDEDEIDASGL